MTEFGVIIVIFLFMASMIGGMKVGWDHPQRLDTPSLLQRSMHLRHPTEHQRDRERLTLSAEVRSLGNI